MAFNALRKCQSCGAMNKDTDYCSQCGALVNNKIRRKLERKKREEEKSLRAATEKNAIASFFQKAKTHPNIVVRSTVKLVYSIWFLVIAIGTFLAFMVGFIAA